ncbi:MAG: DHH family phosphoesterase [Candidatus Hodarchaeales archaeon]|jgi:hypothetical protein
MIHSEILSYIETEVIEENIQYFKDALNLTLLKGRKVAYHGACPDGAISAALMKYLNEGDVFIPLKYDILKDQIIQKYLTEIDWYAIVDLEPFNSKQLDLYVDHHRSIIGRSINSRRIHFESGKSGPSAAWVLYQYAQIAYDIPNYLKQLIEISCITDTASFKIDPPIDIISQAKGSQESLLNDFNKLCWFVQDALNIEDFFSVSMNNHLVDILYNRGILGLFQQPIIKRINSQRVERKKSYDYAKKLPLSPLMIFVNCPSKIFRQTLALNLGKKGVKIIIFLTEREDKVTISLRQSKRNTQNEIEKFRLDLLAKTLNPNGGGHAEAAGSVSTSISEALSKISEWAELKVLEMDVIQY